MFKKIARFVLTLFVAFSLLAVAAPAQAAPLAAPRVARGKIVSINKRTRVVTIQNRLGTNVALKYNARTVVRINGRRVAVSRMHVGDRVVMTYAPATRAKIAGTALECDDTPGTFELEGLVSAVDPVAGTLDIASEHGGSIVQVKVDANTVITREDAAATLADLQFGDKVEARYASGTMLASSIKAETDDDVDEFEGVISAFDATAGTITITPEEGGADVTITTDAATVFMFDDSPGTFADMQVGMEIEAKFDPTTLLATYVEFELEDD
ncbi:MAG: hypothetical protein HY867_15205 [Chloroflexi bacterium]|nr:hypothetical protein [Chloroflexota bacterium]